MRRGRLDQHGREANRCNHRCDSRRADGRGLRGGFEPTRNCAGLHGAGNPCQQQHGRHRRAYAALRSTRRHPLGRGESVRSLVPRPTWSTPASPGLPLPGWSAVTLGPASQGPLRRPTGPRRHRHMSNATGAANPFAWNHHKPASSGHRRSPLTPSARDAFELVKDSYGAVSHLLLATAAGPVWLPTSGRYCRMRAAAGLRGACRPQHERAIHKVREHRRASMFRDSR